MKPAFSWLRKSIPFASGSWLSRRERTPNDAFRCTSSCHTLRCRRSRPIQSGEVREMNLSTSYMGFELPHPLMAGASPMVDDLDKVRRLEDAGAPMIIMHSLFEEQIVAEEVG